MRTLGFGRIPLRTSIPCGLHPVMKCLEGLDDGLWCGVTTGRAVEPISTTAQRQTAVSSSLQKNSWDKKDNTLIGFSTKTLV
jgi:hypothetical protein